MTWLSPEVLQDIANITTLKCTLCNKKGVVVQDGKLKNCTCIDNFRELRMLAEANIPKRYRQFDFRNLTSEFKQQNSNELKVLSTYIANIEQNIAECNWLYLQGKSGLAKSAIASYILRKAVQKQIPGYMIRMSHLTELFFNSFSDAKAKAIVTFLEATARIIVIDEIEKEHSVVNSNNVAGSKIAQIFSDWYDREAVVIFTSNVPKAQLTSTHNPSVVDRIHTAIDIVLTGESFRTKTAAEQKLIQQIHGS